MTQKDTTTFWVIWEEKKLKKKESVEYLIPFLIFYTILHKDGTPLIESDILVIVLVLHIPSKF